MLLKMLGSEDMSELYSDCIWLKDAVEAPNQNLS